MLGTGTPSRRIPTAASMPRVTKATKTASGAENVSVQSGAADVGGQTPLTGCKVAFDLSADELPLQLLPLLSLGGTVDGPETATHLVTKADRWNESCEAARRRGVLLVSPLWIPMCQTSKTKLPEAGFPIEPPGVHAAAVEDRAVDAGTAGVVVESDDSAGIPMAESAHAAFPMSTQVEDDSEADEDGDVAARTTAVPQVAVRAAEEAPGSHRTRRSSTVSATVASSHLSSASATRTRGGQKSEQDSRPSEGRRLLPKRGKQQSEGPEDADAASTSRPKRARGATQLPAEPEAASGRLRQKRARGAKAAPEADEGEEQEEAAAPKGKGGRKKREVGRKAVDDEENSSCRRTSAAFGSADEEEIDEIDYAARHALAPTCVSLSLSKNMCLRETIGGAIRSLGGSCRPYSFADDLKITPKTSHLIVDDETAPRRTMKLLSAMARGIPIVKASWVLHSVSAARWLDYREFLAHPPHPAATRQLKGKAIYIGSSGAVPRAELDELIQWAGGRVVPLRSATHLLNFAVRRARTGHAEPVPRV